MADDLFVWRSTRSLDVHWNWSAKTVTCFLLLLQWVFTKLQKLPTPEMKRPLIKMLPFLGEVTTLGLLHGHVWRLRRLQRLYLKWRVVLSCIFITRDFFACRTSSYYWSWSFQLNMYSVIALKITKHNVFFVVLFFSAEHVLSNYLKYDPNW